MTKAVAGFANSHGGYLILGAERGGDGWSAAGASFPGAEATTWLSSIIQTLTPVPQTDIRTWSLGDGKHLAVVRVDALGTKPCITRDGQIFERTSGQTVPIRDPTALARLYESGERARERAEAVARRALELNPETRTDALGGRTPKNVVLAVALAPTGLPQNMTAQLFGRTFAENTFLEALKPRLHVGQLQMAPWYTTVEQGALTGHLIGHDQAWIVRASWDAAVAFAYASWSEVLTLEDVVRIVREVWIAGVTLLEALRTTGPAHLALTAKIEPKRDFFVARWIPLDAPATKDLDSIARELRRARGEPVWEDEPASA